jgi:hypothetical protein
MLPVEASLEGVQVRPILLITAGVPGELKSARTHGEAGGGAVTAGVWPIAPWMRAVRFETPV